MKYLDEYRDADRARRLADAIASTVTKHWVLMEICGGQTHAIARFGIASLLPEEVKLIHGPGCPVCVTPTRALDQAIWLARQPGITLCAFGDMMRVPATEGDLFRVKSEGGSVKPVYSPMDALALAKRMPDEQVVFLAVGFETTAPANAMAVYQAAAQGVENFSMLCYQVRVPPAIEALLQAPGNKIQGFLAAGHVCAIMGVDEYRPIAESYQVPIVITGFEPVDILRGVLDCVRQLESGRHEVSNQYARSVRESGNAVAQNLVGKVFQTVASDWRGMGVIPESGLGLREDYRRFDAQSLFDFGNTVTRDDERCLSGLVLQGRLEPDECPCFGKECSPEHPLGAPMVSGEGACAAYYRYQKNPVS